VVVQDYGIGISKADQQKIFERFYRAEGASEKTFPGFGIGLFIAAEIISRHGGNIGVDSEPGKGSSFYFSLPLASS
ncbi:MAG TPA: HAMP domain-containing sensor histidine kinase, partial [Puia sp.]|nr:HAMP domain-containing sensor histidine kinase [Puia sp.]